MTIKDRIIDYLKVHIEGIDDTGLENALGLKSRAQANLRCRQLESEGFVKRVVVNGTIHNFWADNYYSTKTLNKSNISSLHKLNMHPQKKTENQKSEAWFWEGNVQSRVINFLVSQKYQIRSVAHTATHQTVIDIFWEKNGKKIMGFCKRVSTRY